MFTESYNYVTLPKKPLYLFLSEGQQGKILKGIVFTPIGKNLWNLAFGDVIDNDINDSVISNNHDFIKLFGTIAKVTYAFSEQFPSRQIYIEPVDEKRKKLYNHIFRRHYEDIALVFHIKGIYQGVEEDYSPEKFYDIFRLKRKFVK
jgi:hypothetical protein